MVHGLSDFCVVGIDTVSDFFFRVHNFKLGILTFPAGSAGSTRLTFHLGHLHRTNFHSRKDQSSSVGELLIC